MMDSTAFIYSLYALFTLLLTSTEGDHIPIYMDEVTNGQQLNLTGIIISHRGYPNDYPANINSRVALPTLDFSLTNIIILNFDYFDISDYFYYKGDDYNNAGFYNDNTCSQSDKLFVTGRNVCNNAARYPGVQVPYRRVVDNSQSAVIQFTTNSDQYVSGGFVLKYTVATSIYPSLNPYRNANQDLMATEGYIASHPDYPELHYFRGVDSRLMLRGLQPGQRVALEFIDFDLYFTTRAPGCNQDYLEIGDISETDLGYIRFCDDPDFKPWYNRTYYVTARSTAMTMKFTTNDYDSVDKGFLFKYTVIPVTTTTSTQAPVTTSSTMPTQTGAISTNPSVISGSSMSSSSTLSTTRSNEGSVTDTVTAGTPRPSKKNNTGAAIGAGVAVGVLVVIVIAVVILIMFRRKKNNKSFTRTHSEHIYDLPPGVERRNPSQSAHHNSAVVTLHNSYDYYNLPDVVTGATPGQKSSKSRKSSAADNKAYIQSNKHKKSEYILAYKPSINEGSAHQRVAVVTSTYSDFDDSDEGLQSPPATADNVIYDVAADSSYQSVGNGGQLYENLATIKRQQQEKEIADEYGVVMAATKTNFKRDNSRTPAPRLVDNDLYGS